MNTGLDLIINNSPLAMSLLNALNMSAIVSITDTAGAIEYVNDKFVEVSKYSREELMGKNHRILKSGNQPDSLFKDMWEKISNGFIWRGEIQNRAKDGSFYWVDTAIAPIQDPSGAPIYYVSIRLVITDKKKMESDLKEKMRMLDTTLQALVERELTIAELKDEILRCRGEISKPLAGHPA